MTSNFDMLGKSLSMRRSFVGILWTPKAKTALIRLLKELVPQDSGDEGREERGEEGAAEEEEETVEGGDTGETGSPVVGEDARLSWAYTVAVRGVEAGFIDPGQEYDVYREPTTKVYY